MTRTYVKGRASSDIKRLYTTVCEGQDIGLSMVHDGADATRIHQAISKHFDQQGYPTKMVRGKQTGFFHGTGHGVGLQIHAAPVVAISQSTLQAGRVVTVEPGLSYPGLGVVRIEGMVVVRKDGCENLTRYKRQLVIQ